MNAADYGFLCRFLKERSGFVLAQEKEYLVQSRLLPVARRNGLSDVANLVQALQTGASAALKTEVIEAMMNNESLFFRDKIPFDRLRDTVLPDLLKRREPVRQIRIWSAAASTGQEPYSVAMMIADRPEFAGWRIDIVATDISNDALEQARGGIYSQFEVQRGLPIQLLMHHFDQIKGEWRIKDRLRNMVQFRQLNLLSNFSALGQFDIVFCRNVLIYFDQPTKIDVLARIRRVTAEDGYLILGAAETMVGLGDTFVPVPDRRALYRPHPRDPAPVVRLVPDDARVA
ncbi:MAG: protein-glutamate O-methyltransferase CheR [Bradyrhizobiaceae bacterium]|nr:protein-glutamate O-methyltransferase CheR [Bradyrhizobiaceae bacterium]